MKGEPQLYIKRYWNLEELDGSATVIQELTNTTMEYHGRIGLSVVLAVMCWWWPQDSPCVSGWASLQKQVKPLPSALFIPKDLLGGFVPARSFFKVPAKRTKILRRSLCKREEWELRMNACRGTGGKLGRLLAPTLRTLFLVVTGRYHDKALGNHVPPAKGPENQRPSRSTRAWTDAFSQMTHLPKAYGLEF